MFLLWLSWTVEEQTDEINVGLMGRPEGPRESRWWAGGQRNRKVERLQGPLHSLEGAVWGEVPSPSSLTDVSIVESSWQHDLRPGFSLP